MLPSGINPIAPAKQPKVGNFTFPITGGIVAPEPDLRPGDDGRWRGNPEERQNLLAADEDHQHRARTAARRRPPSNSKSCRPPPGQTGRSSIVELVFPANSIDTNPTTRQITVAKAEAKLQAPAATMLNTTFNAGDEKAPPASSEFAAGELFGTFSMTLQAQ